MDEINTLGFFAREWQDENGCDFQTALMSVAFGVVPHDGVGISFKELEQMKLVRHEDGSFDLI